MSMDVTPAHRLASEGRIAEATEFLRRAGATGNGDALAALAKHLLLHRPDLAREGLGAATAAVKAGNGEAAQLLSVFIAAGVGFKADWQVALNALLHSAELGWLPSHRELQLLSGDSGTDWPRLRAKVDIPAWLHSPPARPVLASPRIFAVEHFASPAVCDWLIALSRPHLRPAMTYDPAGGGTHYESGRTNSACHLVLPHSDLVVAFLRARMANAVKLSPSWFEITTVLHYQPGQTFAPHHDYLDDGLPGYVREVADHGQRV
ncbi:MAG TPA: hypothetical protein VFW28_18630, partial [Micropepsaceae bacterium]|nr:hypothetical protein [Micropepsaceae bacterium]